MVYILIDDNCCIFSADSGACIKFVVYVFAARWKLLKLLVHITSNIMRSAWANFSNVPEISKCTFCRSTETPNKSNLSVELRVALSQHINGFVWILIKTLDFDVINKFTINFRH